MAAGIKDLNIEAGSTFRLSLQWRQPGPDEATDGPPYDLTGASAQMQIRQRIGSPVLIDLDTGPDDGITLSGVTGMIDILIPWEVTAALAVRKAVYDLFVTFPHSQGREKVLKGKITVDQAVTLADEDTDDEPVDTTPLPSGDDPATTPVTPPSGGVVTQPEANPDPAPTDPVQVDPTPDDTPVQVGP
jgi:hypothetical protein